MGKSLSVSYSKLITTALVGWYFLQCAFHPYPEWHFIDNFNLIIHEAGHTIFIFFGTFIHIVMGSGLQIGLPLLISLYFFFKQQYFSGSLVLALVGYNMVNVSKYIGDAIVMQFELLGGDSVMHDWNALLSMTHLLSQTNNIAALVNGIGILLIFVSIGLSLYYSKKI